MSDKILIVDDEHEIADLIEVYLNNEGYEVFKFYTAREALDCIDRTALDLAILDVMLPEHKRSCTMPKNQRKIHLSRHHADG